MTKKDDILKILKLSEWQKQAQQNIDLQLEAVKIEEPEVYEIITKYKVLDTLITEDMENFVFELYDKYFSEIQVKKLLEFYEDEDTRKIFEDAPKILDEITQKIDSVIQKRLDEIPDE